MTFTTAAWFHLGSSCAPSYVCTVEEYLYIR